MGSNHKIKSSTGKSGILRGAIQSSTVVFYPQSDTTYVSYEDRLERNIVVISNVRLSSLISNL